MECMNICERCFYCSQTRFGAICNYDGTYNPAREKCPNFKPRENVETQIKTDIEFTRLFYSIVDGLIQVSPKIRNLEDESLKNELMEICIAAKQIRKMFG